MSPPPTYQFIIDNPYETVDEMLETLGLAASFPRPWGNPIYSLMLFPGVPLFSKALKDGIIKDKTVQIYTRNWRSQSKPFFQFWIKLYSKNISPLFLRILLNKLIARFLTSDFSNIFWNMKIFRWLWK
jgi:anaerobic magnesium-protoporphyrin IX monomethyl ester cyclase